VPLVLFPQTPEQDAVAKRVEELGAGVRLKSISGEDVLHALRQIIYESAYKDNAAKISESFRACGGATEAASFLEEIAKKPNNVL
jgi:UDP:flavonoid glycosyltransferase YjiC (YdhE family)